MGRCNKASLCEETYCCICCPQNGTCNIQCDYMDSYEYAAECKEYKETDE